jgi:hypothetical protein
MKRRKASTIVILFLVAILSAALLSACGGASKESAAPPPPAQPTFVGSDTCTTTCHAATRDITGTPIADAWAATTHTTDGGVQCENCHGGASLHWGIGPIPYPNPQPAQCNVCHGFSGFDGTRHANANLAPDKFFFQGDAGTTQATLFGVSEFRPDGTTPVTKGEHIEECSRCHNPNQRFTYGTDKVLLKPKPDNVPNPVVSCGSCHDAHQPEQKVTIAQRSTPIPYPVFRKFFVNPTGEQTIDTTTGSSVAAILFQPNGAVQANGTVDATKVVGGNNELNPDRLCAACHTKGLYKYAQTATHQGDVYTEWKESGHGDRTAAAFGEFSANPMFYDATFPLSHQVRYPYDMALSGIAATASTTANAGNNNFVCYKCHHGIGSLAHQEDVQGTQAAPVLFGDVTVTCVTCHDPHTDVAGQTKNTRKPLVMTRYSSGGLTIPDPGIVPPPSVFLDNTPVPSTTGNATICVFCHQGRESGYTLFKRRIAGTITGSFLNPHYLGTGAMLWGRNGYEYASKLYGEVTPHQQTNCYGCHMAASQITPAGDRVGGHTWKIINEDNSVVNSATCNAAACHNGRVPTTNSAGEFNAFHDAVFDPGSDYDGDGTEEGIPTEIAGLENQLIALLQANGIFYSDTSYPYFFTDGTFATGFTAWTGPTLKAAFNLSFVIKGLPSGTSKIGVPNTSAAVHNYRYNIQLLRDSYDVLCAANATNCATAGGDRSAQTRPTGTRSATNYDPQVGGGYNPLQ